jgi:hypothetical protein
MQDTSESCTKSLNPAEQAHLTYLRQRVDNLQEERFRRDARLSINNEIHAAVNELRQFTSNLRKEGRRI